jgi:hypothetical protein
MQLLPLFVLWSLLFPAPGKPLVFVNETITEGSSRTSEIVELLQKSCPAVTITADHENADYIVAIDDTGAGPLRKPNKVVVYNRTQQVVFSTATRSMKSAVKDACAAIGKDWH